MNSFSIFLNSKKMIFVPNQLCYPCNTFATCTPTNTVGSEGIQRSRFTKEEDELLKQLVNSPKQLKWSEIARYLNNRTARQCRERYNNYLRPNLINGPWTKEEDDLLLELFESNGPKWALISQKFNSRSPVNVKNRHASLVSHLNNKNNNKSVNLSIENNTQKSTEIKENSLTNVQLEQNDQTNVQNEQDETSADELFDNMLHNFEFCDDLWSSSFAQLPEDDLFVF